MALIETTRAGEFIIAEANGSISREEVIFDASAGAMVAGTIVGKLASGKYVAYDNTASDGREVAVGILYAPLADKTTDQRGAIVVRHAEVAAALLTGLNDAAKTDLAAAQIIFR